MPSASPTPNLLVLRSPDIDRAAAFYRRLGMQFTKERHGNGPEHYASFVDGFLFELYPQRNADAATTHTRIGFSVADVDAAVDALREINVTIVSEPTHSEWGRRAVVKDLDGHTVELVTPPGNDAN